MKRKTRLWWLWVVSAIVLVSVGVGIYQAVAKRPEAAIPELTEDDIEVHATIQTRKYDFQIEGTATNTSVQSFGDVGLLIAFSKFKSATGYGYVDGAYVVPIAVLKNLRPGETRPFTATVSAGVPKEDVKGDLSKMRIEDNTWVVGVDPAYMVIAYPSRKPKSKD